MDIAIDLLSNAIGNIDKELESLENQLEVISSDNIDRTLQNINIHEKTINNKFKVIRKTIKGEYENEDVFNYEDSNVDNSSIDQLICKDILTNTAPMSANKQCAVGDFKKSVYIEEATRSHSIFQYSWFTNYEMFILDELIQLEDRSFNRRRIDGFIAWIKHKFHSITLVQDLSHALRYLDGILEFLDVIDPLQQKYTSLTCRSVYNCLKKQTEPEYLFNLNIGEQCIHEAEEVNKISYLDMLVSRGAAGTALSYKTLHQYTWKINGYGGKLPIYNTTVNPFHSIFICAIMKEQISSGSKILLLPCKHIFSITAEKYFDNLRCPYCTTPYSEIEKKKVTFL